MSNTEEGAENLKKDPHSIILSTLKEKGHPLSANVQNDLEQVVDSILQINDKEEQKSEIIVNFLQFIISYNQTEQFDTYFFASPEVLERYKNVDEGVYQKVISLTEKSVDQDLLLDAEEARSKIQQADAQLAADKVKLDSQIETERRKLSAEIEIGVRQLELDKEYLAAEIEFNKLKLQHDIKILSKGQNFAFLFAILSLSVGAFAIYNGSAVGGSILSVLGVATTIITSFLKPSGLNLPTLKRKNNSQSDQTKPS